MHVVGNAALAGIRVADFSRVLAGPYATMMLGDFGADVVKVERPSGDETRSWLPPVDHEGRSVYFQGVNRNKRSLECDFTDPGGLRAARRLALSADVLIENFRPGVMDRLGLGFDQLRAQNPRLIYCSITGFGTADGAALPGYDLLVQAVGGLMSITGTADGPPVKAGVAIVDVLAGLNALSGILLALRVRDQTGQGQRVEVNLMSALLAGLVNQASGALATGVPPGRMGNSHPSIAPYDLYRCADRDLVIAVGNDRQFAGLVTALGDPSLATDPRFLTNASRVAHRNELRDALEARLCSAPARHWAAVLTERGVPAGLVNSVPEALELARSLGLDAVVPAPGGAQIANPIGLSASPPSYRLAPPGLGEHPEAYWFDQ